MNHGFTMIVIGKIITDYTIFHSVFEKNDTEEYVVHSFLYHIP